MTVSENEGKGKMKVSVIIPVYNRANMIAEAVSSVLTQTYTDLECIVYDDGSTDGSYDAASSIVDERLKVLTGRNRGVSTARNRAVEESKGEFIAFLDSDDLWLPEKLSRQIEYMESGNYLISHTDEAWMRNGRRVKKGKRNRKIEGWIFKESLATCLISPSCTVISRKVWDECGCFDEKMPAYEDFDLWIRICMKYPVGLINDELTIRNGGREDQLTSRIGYPDLYRIYSMLKLLKYSGLPRVRRNEIEDEIERKLGYFCSGSLKRGKQQDADVVQKTVRQVMVDSLLDPLTVLDMIADLNSRKAPEIRPL